MKRKSQERVKTSVNRHYNWRNTLRDFARISGFLAGFCVTFIGIIVGGSVASKVLFDKITYGNVSILFLGFSTVLFISAYELFLHSKNYDFFEWSKDYRDWLVKGIPEKNWEEIVAESNKKIKVLYRYGALCYNVSIFMLYLGLFFVLAAYNIFIAFSVIALGIALQVLQNKNWIIPKLSSLGVIIKITILIGILLIVLFSGYYLGYISGRKDVVSKVAHHEKVSIELSSNDVLSQLEQHFPEKLNYTQLLYWQSTRINYTRGKIVRHTNPIEILSYGLGRCGEFSILYVSICLANDIPARVVTDLVIDHVWAEVNPSKDGRTWVHVEPTDSCVRIQKGEKSIYDSPATLNNPSLYETKNFQMVFAFQVTEEEQILITDRTSIYT